MLWRRRSNTTFIYASYSDKGSRPVNEDSAGCFEDGENRLFVLCDGLGGHGRGDEASALVVRSLGKSLARRAGQKAESFLQEAFSLAQSELLSEQKKKGASRQMKTTAVALLLEGGKAYIAHVGDSRCYIFDRGRVKARTRDHSIPQMLVMAGEITEQEIRHHPDRSALIRALGAEGEFPGCEVMKPVPQKSGMAFLLCSDGFWELIEETEMEACLARASGPEEWLRLMRTRVEEAGRGQDMDNHTAIGLWVEERS